MRVFNVARPRQRNIYQITSPTTCNLHAYRQTSELHLNSFFVSTTLLSFEQLIHLDYFIWRRVGWWRNPLVARWPDTVKGIETIKRRHIHIRYSPASPLPENRKMRNLKDMKIVAAEISLRNSDPVRIKFSRVLTLSKTRPSSDVWNCENAKT